MYCKVKLSSCRYAIISAKKTHYTLLYNIFVSFNVHVFLSYPKLNWSLINRMNCIPLLFLARLDYCDAMQQCNPGNRKFLLFSHPPIILLCDVEIKPLGKTARNTTWLPTTNNNQTASEVVGGILDVVASRCCSFTE